MDKELSQITSNLNLRYNLCNGTSLMLSTGPLTCLENMFGEGLYKLHASVLILFIFLCCICNAQINLIKILF